MDTAAVLDIAHRYDATADLLDTAVQRCAAALTFGAARAGRDYTDAGAEVRRAVDDTVGALRAWSRSSREIAAELRVSAADYAHVDERAAGRIG